MIKIYGKDGCPLCVQAKQLCESRGFDYEYLILDEDYSKEYLVEKFQTEYGVTPRTMPQIEGNLSYIGGFAELKKMLDTP